MRPAQVLSSLLLIFYFSISVSKAQKYLPPTGKTMLIIGQDLASINNYVTSGYFPTPTGVTAYVDFYNLANPTAYFPFGGLGEKLDGTTAPDIDWGAGPLNARNAALGYPNSVLSIGLSLVEDYAPNGLSKIAAGDYDTEITRLANFIKTKNKPVYVRIGYEFDGKWNTGYANTTNYKNAYKRIVDIIRPIAPNFVSVWQACTSPVDDILEGYHEDISAWYPGDNYVDWMGYSWFLNTPQQVSLTDEVTAFARLHSKPVMVCESSPQGYDLKNLNYRYINTMLGGQPGTNPVSKTPDQLWNEWFKPFFDYIHTNSDVIRAVSYINANWDAQAKWGSPYNEGYWGDSRVEANADIRAKWLAEISKTSWIPGSSTLFTQLTGKQDTIVTPPTSGTGAKYAPAAGKTLMIVGQTYTQEYKDYVNATKKAPAGSSHYGEIYNGKINQGDDANNESFLSYIETTYPKAYAEVAISIKDNPAAGGYSGENGIWKACKDISAGKWNTQIDLFAQSLKNRPTLKFLIRIDYEVSLNMFANKTTTPFVQILDKYNKLGINPLERANEVTEFDLQAYPDAFNYIAKRIRETNQVPNVDFVFHPVRGFNDAKWLYPGNAYTDWYGISLFNHDMCYPTWEPPYPFVNCPSSQAMDDNVKQSLNWAKNTIKKPIIIAESAVQAELTNQHNTTFMNGYIDKVTSLIETYDVKAWVYINSNWVGHSWSAQWGDSRIESIADVKTHWLAKVSDPRYIHYPTVVTGIENYEQATDNYELKVYPNPAKDKLHISSESVPSKIELFNQLGQLQLEVSNENTINIGSLPEGVYLMKMKLGEQTKFAKVVKE